MFKYLKDYLRADMRQIISNDRAEQRRCNASMVGKMCPITGCTSGVGWEAARTLAAHGATVLLINRSEEESERECTVLRTDFGVEYGYLLADFADQLPGQGNFSRLTLAEHAFPPGGCILSL